MPLGARERLPPDLAAGWFSPRCDIKATIADTQAIVRRLADTGADFSQLIRQVYNDCYTFSHMAQDTVAEAEVACADEEATVMASVEDEETLIIADVTQDDAYLTLPLEAAASLPAWR
jgi:hypothetical protein